MVWKSSERIAISPKLVAVPNVTMSELFHGYPLRNVSRSIEYAWTCTQETARPAAAAQGGKYKTAVHHLLNHEIIDRLSRNTNRIEYGQLFIVRQRLVG